MAIGAKPGQMRRTERRISRIVKPKILFQIDVVGDGRAAL